MNLAAPQYHRCSRFEPPADREHYARTLRAWVGNLRSNWDAAVAEVGIERARVGHLYMAASAHGFADGGT